MNQSQGGRYLGRWVDRAVEKRRPGMFGESHLYRQSHPAHPAHPVGVRVLVKSHVRERALDHLETGRITATTETGHCREAGSARMRRSRIWAKPAGCGRPWPAWLIPKWAGRVSGAAAGSATIAALLVVFGLDDKGPSHVRPIGILHHTLCSIFMTEIRRHARSCFPACK